jgi:hypothetical protein
MIPNMVNETGKENDKVVADRQRETRKAQPPRRKGTASMTYFQTLQLFSP